MYEDLLYIHQNTLNCALNQCIPCLYKVIPSGIFKNPNNESDTRKLPPNQRPELCRRSKCNEYNGLYSRSDNKKILVLGDGDFSFSLSLARYFNDNNKNNIYTSYETRNNILNIYNNSSNILRELESLDAIVRHEVDATDLPINNQDILPFNKFDIIIFNFPCIRISNGLDGQVDQLNDNKNLIRQFFHQCKLVLNDNTSEIHLTHKTIEPFNWWDITGIASECGFKHIASIIFDRYLYPGYINRKVLDKRSFPSNDAVTYIFQSKDDIESDSKSTSLTLSNPKITLLNNIEIKLKLYKTLTTMNQTNNNKRKFNDR